MRSSFSRFLLVCVTGVMVLGYAFTCSAQSTQTSGGGKSILLGGKKNVNGLRSLSLLDPERFTMKNQYIMSFSSVGGSGSLMGMYINTMEYRFNCPLIMRLKVAYQSQTGRLFGNKSAFTGNPNLQDGRLFIPSFDLVYQPFKTMTISVHYRDYSSLYSNYGYWGYGYYNRFNRHSPFMMW